MGALGSPCEGHSLCQGARAANQVVKLLQQHLETCRATERTQKSWCAEKSHRTRCASMQNYWSGCASTCNMWVVWSKSFQRSLEGNAAGMVATSLKQSFRCLWALLYEMLPRQAFFCEANLPWYHQLVAYRMFILRRVVHDSLSEATIWHKRQISNPVCNLSETQCCAQLLISKCFSTNVLVHERKRWATRIDMSRVKLATSGAAEHARKHWVLLLAVGGATGAVTMVFENT